jgi:hypothetical protein
LDEYACIKEKSARDAAFAKEVNRTVGSGSCQDCLNTSTTGKNLLGLTYPGGNNPRSYNGRYNYSYMPTYRSEYPAIGHDRRYDNLKI